MKSQNAITSSAFSGRNARLIVTRLKIYLSLLIWVVPNGCVSDSNATCLGAFVGSECTHSEALPKEMATDEIEWLRGREIDKALKSSLNVDFQQSPLREQLVKFSKRQKIGVFIDRRVDPSLELSLSLVDVTFEQALWRIADEFGYGVCRLGDIFYFGPQQASNSLPVLFAELKKQTRSGSDSDTWKKKGSFRWPRLTKPRDLMGRIWESSNLKIENEKLIPHDLWPESDLPDLALYERLGLLVVGFDVWLDLEGKRSVALVEFPELQSGSLVVRNVDDAKSVAKALKSAVSDIKVSATGRSVKLSGNLEALLDARRWLVELQKTNSEATESVFSINTKASRKAILNKLAGNLGCVLQAPATAEAELRTVVEINLENQPVEGIITEVLKGTNLRFSIRGTVLKVD